MCFVEVFDFRYPPIKQASMGISAIEGYLSHSRTPVELIAIARKGARDRLGPHGDDGERKRIIGSPFWAGAAHVVEVWSVGASVTLGCFPQFTKSIEEVKPHKTLPYFSPSGPFLKIMFARAEQQEIRVLHLREITEIGLIDKPPLIWINAKYETAGSNNECQCR